MSSNGTSFLLNIRYDGEQNLFILNNQNEEVLYYEPVLKVDTEYETENFEIVLFQNDRNDYSENSIYQVYVPDKEDRKRIGWIFPIQALESLEHSCAQNEFFLKYAYIALYKLFEIDNTVYEGKYDDRLKLSDLFKMNETVLVIDKYNTAEIEGFNFEEYLVSLYSFGYSLTGKGNLFDSCNHVEGNRLNLKRISNQVQGKDYIVAMFKDLIPNTSDNISRFYICYQIVEILIAAVFNIEFQEFVNVIASLGVEADLFSKKDELLEKTNERTRVRKLVNNYSVIDSYSKAVLKERCDEFLKLYGACVPDDAASSLYDVRCMLVHRCYMINSEGNELLAQINDIFYSIAIQMLTSFRKPK